MVRAMKANVFHESDTTVPSIQAGLEKESIACANRVLPDTPEALAESIDADANIIFLPALEEDCLGVKYAQAARLDNPLPAIVLYADKLPASEFLCLAFREGADDVLATQAGDEAVQNAVVRARRLVKSRLEDSGSGSGGLRESNDLQQKCSWLERQNARLEERLLALASAASRLASGELRLAESAPYLIICAASKPQSASAAEVGEHLGFDVHIAMSGSEALEEMKKRSPQVILSDGTLPDMNVTELAAAARKAIGNKPVIIIAWSSNPELEDRLLKPESGIDDFVQKSATTTGTGLLAAAFLGALR